MQNSPRDGHPDVLFGEAIVLRLVISIQSLDHITWYVASHLGSGEAHDIDLRHVGCE